MGRRMRRNVDVENFDEEVSVEIKRRRGTGHVANQNKKYNEPSYKKNLTPRSENQKHLIESIDNNIITFGIGVAGTGKTYIAVHKAVDNLKSGNIKRIILCRPAVEADEKIGFLPGDASEKLDPYMRPFFDCLVDIMGTTNVKKYIDEGIICIEPLGFMRGRTFNNAFIVVDEAQNMTRKQLKMVITRLGMGSTMVITGDPDQTDLKPGESGLLGVVKSLKGRDNQIGVVELEGKDIIRHPLISRVLEFIED